MQKTQFLLLLILSLCGRALGEVQQVAAEAEVSTNAVPESTAAILLGGILWFLLLRKRA